MATAEPAAAGLCVEVLRRLENEGAAQGRIISLLRRRYGHGSDNSASAAAHLAVCDENFDAAAAIAVATLVRGDSDGRVRAAASEALAWMGGLGVPGAAGLWDSLASDLPPLPSETGLAQLDNEPPKKSSDSKIDAALSQSTRAHRLILHPNASARQAGVEALGAVSPHRSGTMKCDGISSLPGTIGVTLSGFEKVEQATVLLRDHDARVRSAALQTLGKLASQLGVDSGTVWAAKADAVARLLRDADAGVRAAAARSLAELEEYGSRHAAAVASLIQDSDPTVRQAAVEALGRLRNCSGAAQAAVYLRHTLSDVRAAAALALGACGAAVAAAHAPEVAALLADGATDARNAAVYALPRLGPSGAPAAVELLRHAEPRVRRAAAAALGMMGGAGADDVVCLLQHREATVQCAALAALGAMGEAAAEHAPAVASQLQRKQKPVPQARWAVRLEAVKALGKLGIAAIPYSPHAMSLLADREPDVRAAAAMTLAQLVILNMEHRCS